MRNMHAINLMPTSILLRPLPLNRQIRMTLQRLPQIIHTMPIMTILDLVQDHSSDIRGIVPHSFEESEVVATDDLKAVELVVKGYGVDLAIGSEFAWGKVVFGWLVDKDIAPSELETGSAFKGVTNEGEYLLEESSPMRHCLLVTASP